jgi:hypothetical protein
MGMRGQVSNATNAVGQPAPNGHAPRIHPLRAELALYLLRMLGTMRVGRPWGRGGRVPAARVRAWLGLLRLLRVVVVGPGVRVHALQVHNQST